MIIKGGFHNTTKTQVRKTLKYLGISRSQLERELVEQGATIEDGMIMPLYRWFAMYPTVEDPLDPRTKEMVGKYDRSGRDRPKLVKVNLEQIYKAPPGTNLIHDLGQQPTYGNDGIICGFRPVDWEASMAEIGDSEYLDDEPNPNNSDGLSNADLRERNEHELWRNPSLWT